MLLLEPEREAKRRRKAADLWFPKAHISNYPHV